MCLISVSIFFELETLYSFTVPLTSWSVFEVLVFVVNSLKWCKIKIFFFLQKSDMWLKLACCL
jgi:hypothetical protein